MDAGLDDRVVEESAATLWPLHQSKPRGSIRTRSHEFRIQLATPASQLRN